MNTENILKLFGKYRLYALPLLSFLAAVLLAIFVFVPQIVILVRTNQEIGQTKARIRALQTKASFLGNLDTTSYTNNLTLAYGALPTDNDIPATISQVQSLLTTSELQLVSMGFAGSNVAQPNADNVKNFSIKIEVLGTSTALKQFINSLSDAPEVMKLTSLDITGSRLDTIDANISLETFYLSNPTSIGDVEQPVSGLTQSDTDLLTKITQDKQTVPSISSDLSGPRGKANPFQ